MNKDLLNNGISLPPFIFILLQNFVAKHCYAHGFCGSGVQTGHRRNDLCLLHDV